MLSQYEGPGVRENLMVTIKKGVEKMEVCFNRETPKHCAGFSILLRLSAVAQLFPCNQD